MSAILKCVEESSSSDESCNRSTTERNSLESETISFLHNSRSLTALRQRYRSLNLFGLSFQQSIAQGKRARIKNINFIQSSCSFPSGRFDFQDDASGEM